MFKKNVLVIVAIISCNITSSSHAVDNQTNKPKPDNRYAIGDLILINTVALTTAYVLGSVISNSSAYYGHPENADKILNTITAIAFMTTTGCVIVETINGIDHLANPSNKKNPELKADIKKLSDQKQ